MFYSQFILAKKGPLGTIWIAAHLERKLRKNQVADTDIGVSVDSIICPEVPIALRLSSHLLLGVVRIYSKKVNYLFNDCSEALLKIKQAFRSNAVDLPPEESVAPYHSITLPETFHLDDFELPDSAGDFVDHHVSTKEQITLQDSVDGAGFSTMQFGLDERFGDGNASHIGLDLDEVLFLDKQASSQVEFSTLSRDDRVMHPGQSSSSFPGNAMDVDDNQIGFFDETKVEAPEQFGELGDNDGDDELDFDSVVDLNRNDVTPHSHGYDIRTPDLNLLFFQNDHSEVPPGATGQVDVETNDGEIQLPNLAECSHAPSTTGILVQIFSTNLPESPELSPQHKHSTSSTEVGIRTESAGVQPECPDSITNNTIEVVTEPHSLETGNVGSSPTLMICERVNDITILSEMKNKQNETDALLADLWIRTDNSCLQPECPGSATNHTMEVVTEPHSLEALVICERVNEVNILGEKKNEQNNKTDALQADVWISTDNFSLQPECPGSATINTMGVVTEPHSLESAIMESFPKSMICEREDNITMIGVNLNEQNNIEALQSKYVNSELKDQQIDDIANKDGTSVLAPVARLEVNKVPAEIGTLVENIPEVPVRGPDITCQTAAEEYGLRVENSYGLLDKCPGMLNVGNDCFLHDKSVITRAESVREVSSINELSSSILQNQPDQLKFFTSCELAEPEKMLLAPTACVNLAYESSHVMTEKTMIESDGSVNKITGLSGKKRQLTESALLLPGDNISAKISSRQRIRSTNYVPNDDDLLASILVGKGTPLLRIAPSPTNIPSCKRPTAKKRKVVWDDASVLHADVIRQQLISTEDIRRIRRKAPCTRPEIWLIERKSLADEFFYEPILTGVSMDLHSLHARIHDSQTGQHSSCLNACKIFDVSGVPELVKAVKNKEKIELSSIMPEKTERQVPTEEVIYTDCQSRKGTDECVTQELLASVNVLPQVEQSSHDLQSTLLITDTIEEKIAEVYVGPQDQRTPSDLIANEAQQLVAEHIQNVNAQVEQSINDLQSTLLTTDTVVEERFAEFFAVTQEQTTANDVIADETQQLVAGPVQIGDAQVEKNDASFNADEGGAQSTFIDVNAFSAIQNEDVCTATDPTSQLDILATTKSGNGVLTGDNQLLEQEADMTSLSHRLGDMECDGTVLTASTGHEGLDEREGMFDAKFGAESSSHKDIHNEENHVSSDVFTRRPEIAVSSLTHASSEKGNFPSTIGENTDFREINLERSVDVESMPLDLTGTKECSDFCSAIDGNDTEFLNMDDEVDFDEEADNDDMSDPQDSRSLENSGWSSRTRGVARYLQSIFDEESGLGRKDVTVDRLIAGKTRKEASRMFFETLVLKTKDYIHVEQDNPFDGIVIKPKPRLLKSEF